MIISKLKRVFLKRKIDTRAKHSPTSEKWLADADFLGLATRHNPASIVINSTGKSIS